MLNIIFFQSLEQTDEVVRHHLLAVKKRKKSENVTELK